MTIQKKTKGAVNGCLTPKEGGKTKCRVFSSEYKAKKFARDNGYKIKITPFS